MSETDAATGNRFEADIQRFEEQDRHNPPPSNTVLFVGSSSFRLWETLAEDFAGIEILNRGFGGALLEDVLHFLPRIVLPYQPRIIVLYGGSLDLHQAGAQPEQILAMFQRFHETVHAHLPATQVYYLSMKPSIAKWEEIELDRAANELIENYVATVPNTGYIDIWTPMVAESVPPPATYFQPDLNHLNREGYKLWAAVIRRLIDTAANCAND